MNFWTSFFGLAVAFIINLPMGYWRSITRKFSKSWFLAVHLSVPFIIIMRLELGLGYAFIPFFITAAVAGQLTGGKWFYKVGEIFNIGNSGI